MMNSSRPFLTIVRTALKATTLSSVINNICVYLVELTERRRQRRALALVDHRLLKDIGISPKEAREEANRPCWQR